jgi:hypothetical protein
MLLHVGTYIAENVLIYCFWFTGSSINVRKLGAMHLHYESTSW